MLDYKSIIIKRYALGLSYKELAEEFSASKSGINDFIRAFERCEKLSYPLPEGITNYAIYELVYGHEPGTNRRNAGYEQPDFAAIFRQMNERKNMTLVYLWSRYQKDCTAREVKPYQYRQFCELYARWCNENYETLHIQAVIAQKMEVDFAGKTFELIDKLTGEITTIVVFVAVLPYSQYIYAEGMISTCEPQWIEVNNHALDYFGGVPTIVVCDNCKQAVTTNNDWIDPDLNKDLIRHDRQVYNLADWEYGYTDCEQIESPERAASYITKYVTTALLTNKEMYNKKRYYNSQGFRHIRSLMVKVQDRAKEIKHLQDKVLPDLKQQLAETKGIFKGKERKALEAQI